MIVLMSFFFTVVKAIREPLSYYLEMNLYEFSIFIISSHFPRPEGMSCK